MAAAEFVLLVFLCVRLHVGPKRPSEKDGLKRRILEEGGIGFANVTDSSFKAKPLYDELKRKCHPDKFAKDEATCAKVAEIFGLLVRNKHTMPPCAG